MATSGTRDAIPSGMWERPAVTRDGLAYRIRPIRADDVDREREFIMNLSPESRYSRLGTMGEPPPDLVQQFVRVDYERSMAFVAVPGRDDAESIIGVARYADDGTSGAEFAVVVKDEWQGRGVGRSLSELLFDYARTHGIEDLHATMLATNRRMVGLAHRLGMTTLFDPADPSTISASRLLLAP